MAACKRSWRRSETTARGRRTWREAHVRFLRAWRRMSSHKRITTSLILLSVTAKQHETQQRHGASLGVSACPTRSPRRLPNSTQAFHVMRESQGGLPAEARLGTEEKLDEAQACSMKRSLARCEGRAQRQNRRHPCQPTSFDDSQLPTPWNARQDAKRNLEHTISSAADDVASPGVLATINSRAITAATGVAAIDESSWVRVSSKPPFKQIAPHDSASASVTSKSDETASSVVEEGSGRHPAGSNSPDTATR